MPNGRCRKYGRRTTGARTADGVAAIRAARTKHGGYSTEIRELRLLMRQLTSVGATIREKTGRDLD